MKVGVVVVINEVSSVPVAGRSVVVMVVVVPPLPAGATRYVKGYPHVLLEPHTHTRTYALSHTTTPSGQQTLLPARGRRLSRADLSPEMLFLDPNYEISKKNNKRKA
ncbi:hypothetical protein E2C01_023080 [Portunus trituberculatus]|uniref:Uncharacterized protein n=1 Tax=Portunus trituberculatus TaxID=210409 RepID=A0A5B7E8S7_PORTR|nr:hypothetical protein [Portunus trituberculatus]